MKDLGDEKEAAFDTSRTERMLKTQEDRARISREVTDRLIAQVA